MPLKREVVSLQLSSMSSQATVEDTHVDVGERLRAIRKLRRVTLRTVAERAELSESFLSQVERGRANASIASLKRIAAALGVNVADLFEPNGKPSRPRVLRRDVRPSLTFGTLGRKYMLTPRPLEHLQVIVGELDAGGSTGDEPTRMATPRSCSSCSKASSTCSSVPTCSSSKPATRSTTAALHHTD